MNGYNPYPSPYTGRRYGPMLSATQGFLNSYMQHLRFQQQMRGQLQNEQYRRSLMDINRSRLGFEERRVKLAEKKEKRFALAEQEPEKYSVPWFEDLGYSSETAQKLQDIKMGATPKLQTPSEQARTAKMFMENALSEEEYNIGEEMLREAMDAMVEQRRGSAPSRLLFGETQHIQAGQPIPTDQELQGMLPAETPQITESRFGVPKGLEEIWDELNEEEKVSAKERLRRGETPESIILLLRSKD